MPATKRGRSGSSASNVSATARARALKYFETAPEVRILAGAAEVGRFAPAADFSQEITVPAGALDASEGMLTVESSLWFTPAQRGESADQRHLALRVYSVNVK